MRLGAIRAECLKFKRPEGKVKTGCEERLSNCVGILRHPILLVNRCLEVAATAIVDENRWDEKAGLRRDAVRSQVIDVLKAQEIKETGNEEG
jgi:hypothetical protein